MKKEYFLRSLAYLKSYIPWIIVSVLVAVLYSTSNVYFLALTKDIVKGIGDRDISFFTNQMLNLLGLIFARVTADKSQAYLMSYILGKISIEIKQKLYKNLLDHSQYFYSRKKIGDILNRLFGDTERIKDGVLSIFKDVIPQVITFIAVLIYMLRINWILTTVTVLSIPVFIVLLPRFAGKLKQATHQEQRKGGDIGHIAQEILGNVKLVQAYTMEENEHKRMLNQQISLFKIGLKSLRIKLSSEYFIEFLQYCLMALVIWLGGYMVVKGKLSPESLASFFVGIMVLIDPVIKLSKALNKIQTFIVSAERVFKLEDTKNTIIDKENAVSLTEVRGDVVFNNVSFAYNDVSGDVIHDVSFSASSGEIVALVGFSGAGKSTLINLIPRFYDPIKGSISLDGIDLRDLKRNDLRKNIGLVMQENILFRGSIADNIKYGSENATMEEIKEAAKKANAWEFISTVPGKLKARVGDRGLNLSGGQRQRISIARAILRNPKILLLDEATSALDSKSEKLVQEALDKLMKNRTTFVIAHRLSTIMHADKIILLDEGKIKEVGSHDELIKKNGYYANLYELQFKNQLNKKKENDKEKNIN